MYAEGDNNTKTVEIKLCKASIKNKTENSYWFCACTTTYNSTKKYQATTKVITVGDFLQFANKL